MKFIPSFSGSPVSERIGHHETEILTLEERIRGVHPFMREAERVKRGYQNILSMHETKLRYLRQED